MNLAELLTAIGGITTVLIQGLKTIPFVKNNSWLAVPLSVVVGLFCTVLYVSSQANHFVFSWALVWPALNAGLAAGGLYAASSSLSTKYQSYKAAKAAKKAAAAQGFTNQA